MTTSESLPLVLILDDAWREPPKQVTHDLPEGNSMAPSTVVTSIANGTPVNKNTSNVCDGVIIPALAQSDDDVTDVEEYDTEEQSMQSQISKVVTNGAAGECMSTVLITHPITDSSIDERDITGHPPGPTVAEHSQNFNHRLAASIDKAISANLDSRTSTSEVDDYQQQRKSIEVKFGNDDDYYCVIPWVACRNGL